MIAARPRVPLEIQEDELETVGTVERALAEHQIDRQQSAGKGCRPYNTQHECYIGAAPGW